MNIQRLNYKEAALFSDTKVIFGSFDCIFLDCPFYIQLHYQWDYDKVSKLIMGSWSLTRTSMYYINILIIIIHQFLSGGCLDFSKAFLFKGEESLPTKQCESS